MNTPSFTPNDAPASRETPGMSRRKLMAIIAASVTGGIVIDEAVRKWNTGEEVQTYTERDVQAHINASRKQWKKAGDILLSGSAECLDGRGDQCEVGEAGGDMGDMLSKISSFEQATNTRFSEKELEEIFDRYLEHHQGQFYMHSDDHAVHALAHHKGTSENEMLEMLSDPGKNASKLLTELSDPKYVGCGHLKRMLQHPEEYPGIRPEMVRTCLKKFFREKWNKNPKMQYAILHGDHREGAVVNVRTAHDEITHDTPVPLLQPKVRNSSVFLLHGQLSDLSAVQWGEDALKIMGMNEFHAQRARQLIKETRDRYLESTAKALAKDKPVYNAMYNPDRLIFEGVQRA